MAETSRSRVTITLGRSGQVVKRSGEVSDSGFYDSHPAAGSKRSVRERIGSDVDRAQLNSKRQREDSSNYSLNAANGVDDLRLGKDDLRFKLMRKNGFRRGQSGGKQHEVDLRETLSRTARVPTTHIDKWQHMPKPNDARKHMPGLNDSSTLRRIPSSRSTDPYSPIDSIRNRYSSWTLDSLRHRSPDRDFLRHRSPDRDLGTLRGFSTQRNEEELPKRSLMRTYDDVRTRDAVRTVPCMSKDGLEPSRPLGTTTLMSRPTVHLGSMKPVASLPRLPSPPNGFVQKSSYNVEEPSSVESFLRSLGLEKYAISFKVEEVDMTALRQMGDHDLKELGIPMGPRKKIMLALLSRSKRQL